MQSDTEIQEWWRDRGGEERAPDKRGGKGQPPLQVVPCSGEEEEEGRKKNRKEKRWQRRREREWVSSGRVRRRKEQWPIERRGNCLAKAIQHKQENSPCIEAGGGIWWTSEVEGGGTVWQSHRTTGWAGRRKVLWSRLFSSSHFTAVLGFVSPPSSHPLHPPPPVGLLFTGRAPWLWYAAASPSACGRRAAPRSPGSSTASSGRTQRAGSRLGRPSCIPSLPGAPPLSTAERQTQIL